MAIGTLTHLHWEWVQGVWFLLDGRRVPVAKVVPGPVVPKTRGKAGGYLGLVVPNREYHLKSDSLHRLMQKVEAFVTGRDKTT